MGRRLRIARRTLDRIRRSAPAAALASLAACAAGPDFRRPAPPAATTYLAAQPASTAEGGAAADTGATAGVVQTFPPAATPPTHWWEAFGSPGLDDLVARALAASPNVHAALARLRAAQADAQALTGATRYPALDGSLTASRQRIDPAAYGFTTLPSPRPYDLYYAAVNARYALDLFGADRRTVEAARATEDGRRCEFEAVRLTLAANVVTTAIRRAALAAEIAVTESLLQVQAAQLQILEQRAAQGGIAESDLQEQRRVVAGTQARLPPLQGDSQRLTHQLAVYTGREPAATAPAAVELQDLHLPAELPLTLPAVLVRRRPDVAAAEAALRRAGAEVGIAAANLYPRLTLTAAAGSQGTAGLVDSANVWSFGAQLLQPIFRGGELRARRRAAGALQDAAAADYEFTVLTALQQVADGLTAVSADARAMAARAAAVAAAETEAAIMRRRFDLGGVSRYSQLEAERTALQARLDATAALADRLADSAALLHAVGGSLQDAPHG